MLLEVLHRASYAQDGQIVHLGAYDKEQICKATHKSMRRLEQAITTWVKNRVLIRVARGIYQVNPFIFGRGDWRDIANLRATFSPKALLPLHVITRTATMRNLIRKIPLKRTRMP